MKKIMLIMFSLLLITGCNKEEPIEILEPNKVNLNEKVIEEKQINDLLFKDTSVIYDKNITTFKTILINNGNDIDIKNIYVECYSKSGFKILTLTKEINKTIKNNEKTQIAIATDIDLTDIYEVKYSID